MYQKEAVAGFIGYMLGQLSAEGKRLLQDVLQWFWGRAMTSEIMERRKNSTAIENHLNHLSPPMSIKQGVWSCEKAGRRKARMVNKTEHHRIVVCVQHSLEHDQDAIRVWNVACMWT